MADILTFLMHKSPSKEDPDVEALVLTAVAVAASTGASEDAILHISEWARDFWVQNKSRMEAGVSIPGGLPHDAALSMLRELRDIYRNIVQELVLQNLLLELDVYDLRKTLADTRENK